ncbi:MAG: rod shape-determining protein RodA [Lachnospiraceae bacterium]|nr:rod shape-determining protein RodA [Lachnospiraceae bacterium]
MFKRYSIKNYNFKLILFAVLQTIIGILVIGSAKDSVQGKQIAGLILGLAVMIVVSFIDYSYIMKFSWIIYFINLTLLALVFVIGKTTGGATRWITIAGIQFQPSELSKILLILFFAYFFMQHQSNLNTLRILILSFALVGVPLLMIKKQPDLSTTIVTALIFIALLFIAGLSYKIVLVVLAVSVPSALIFIYLVLQPDQTILDEYQYNRIMGWLYPEEYSDSAYQQQNSIMAIGSGQLWGKGLNNSQITSVKNGNFISEPQTDFIFAVLGEELGFVGACVVIGLMFFIVIECILTARKAKDTAGRLICCGMAALIGFQSFVNICVATGIMPNTGLPLPFVSYGLTSLVSLYMGLGVVLNIGLQPKKFKMTSEF